MLKRSIATGLWFLSMWFVGATVAYAVGLPNALGPAFAITAALFVGIDPRGLFWPRTATHPNPRIANRLATMGSPEGAH